MKTFLPLLKNINYFVFSLLLFIFCLVHFVLVYYSSKTIHHYFIENNLSLAIILYLIPYFILGVLSFKFRDFFWLKKKSFYIVISCFLMICYFFYPPSDDVNRYLWEGHISQAPYQINPYITSPEKISPQEVQFSETIYHGINNKDKSAIYGPVFMFIMQKITFFSPEYLPHKIPYKVICSFLFLLIIIVTLSLLSSYGLPYQNIFFFLNPLVCIYLIGEAHNDIFILFFLCLSLWFYQRKKYFLTLLFFLGAVHIKIIFLIFFPFFLKKEFAKLATKLTTKLPFINNRLGNSDKVIKILLPSLLLPLLYLGMSFLLYLPFVLLSTEGFSLLQIQQFFSSLFYFGNHMTYNAFVYFWLSPKILYLALFLFLNGWVYLLSKNPFTLLTSVYLIFLCFSPTIHPWYLGVLLWLNIFCQSRAIWLWSVCFVFTFIPLHSYYSTGQWQDVKEWRYFIHLPFVLFLLWEFYKNQFRNTFAKVSWVNANTENQISENSKNTHNENTPYRVSIVIPLANETKQALMALENLQRLKTLDSQDEIIFVEATNQPHYAKDISNTIIDSNDGFSIQKHLIDFENYHYYQSPVKGRGVQIAIGVEKAKNPIVCILHSDVLINDIILETIRESFKDKSVGHLAFATQYFHSSNTESNKKFNFLKIISWLNKWRGQYLHIFFGDQVQCFQKDSLSNLGNFPRLHLMEDIELSLQYKTSFYKTVFIKRDFSPNPSHAPLVSARKWEKKATDNKATQHALIIILLSLSYLFLRFFMIRLPSKFTGSFFMKIYYGVMDKVKKY